MNESKSVKETERACIKSIKFDYDKFGLPQEGIKKLKNKNKIKKAKKVKAQEQAEFLFTGYLYPEAKHETRSKKIAIIYSANSKQSERLYEYYGGPKKNYEDLEKIIYGSNQAKMFKNITQKFSANQVAEENFHILPITTVIKGITEDSCPKADHIVRDLLNILEHLDNGWDVYVLENTEDMMKKPGEKKYQVGNGKAREVFYGRQNGQIRVGNKNLSYGDFVQKFIYVLFNIYGQGSNLSSDEINTSKKELENMLHNITQNNPRYNLEEKANNSSKIDYKSSIFSIFFNDTTTTNDHSSNSMPNKEATNSYSERDDESDTPSSASNNTISSMQSIIPSPRSSVKKTSENYNLKNENNNSSSERDGKSNNISDPSRGSMKNVISSPRPDKKKGKVDDSHSNRGYESDKYSNNTRNREKESDNFSSRDNYDLPKNYLVNKKFKNLVMNSVNAEQKNCSFSFTINQNDEPRGLNITLNNRKELNLKKADVEKVLFNLRNGLIAQIENTGLTYEEHYSFELNLDKGILKIKSEESGALTIIANLLKVAGADCYNPSQFADSKVLFFSKPRNNNTSDNSENQTEPKIVREINCSMQ